MFDLFKEFWLFIKYKKRYWVTSIIIIIILILLIIVLTESQPLVPTIYKQI